jgi:FlaG/FlaF family flagellin (archaellin)
MPRRLKIAAVIALAAVILYFKTGYDGDVRYSKHHNTYVLVATVTAVTPNQISLKNIEVQKSDGAAYDWYDNTTTDTVRAYHAKVDPAVKGHRVRLLGVVIKHDTPGLAFLDGPVFTDLIVLR